MSMVYRYDDKVLYSYLFILILQGYIYPFFFLMILLLIFIPTTISFVRHYFRNLTTSVGMDCTCKPCVRKAQRFKWRRRQLYLKPTFLMSLILLGGGWYTIIQLSTTVHASPQLQIWDPFRLLNVSTFSSTTQIKRQYKRKSLKFHPDKRPKNVTKEEAEGLFIDITKAYKA